MQVYKNSYDQEFGDEMAEPSLLIKIQTLELSLQKAVADISLLQQNLSYVIQVKQELSCELKVREQKERCLTEQYQKQLNRKDREIERLTAEQEQYCDLLTDVKTSLNMRETSLLQKQDQIKRLSRLLQDQKATIQILEGEVLATRYGADLSCQSVNEEVQRIEELEKLNELLRFEGQKGKAQLEKEIARGRKLEREVEQFKSWLAGVVGLRKVVEGCETVLMQQIGNRLRVAPKYQYDA